MGAADPSKEQQGRESKPALYVVATPIGNLEDISLRAIRILKEADLIACEDTRQTQKLLQHYGIATPTVSYHEHNEVTRADELVKKLEEGLSIALVTDAGVPGISDPGYRLISLAVRHQIPIVPIPGPAAFLASLVASGLATDSFRFSGFLPPRQSKRRQVLDSIRNSPRTQIFYEAPHRIRECLEDVVEIMGPDRRLVIAREVTKLHEEFLRGRAADLLELVTKRELKGEITLLIAKADDTAASASVADKNRIQDRFNQILAEQKLDEKTALKKLANEMGLSRSEAYRELQRSRAPSPR
jgi:16S rRNA (cytidine1402-2'-O)-methyltransferase